MQILRHDLNTRHEHQQQVVDKLLASPPGA